MMREAKQTCQLGVTPKSADLDEVRSYGKCMVSVR